MPIKSFDYPSQCLPGGRDKSGLTPFYHFYKFGSMKQTDALTSLAALAQETRLALFRLLVQFAPGGLPAGEIAEKLKVPAPTLSFHLKELSRAGLVDHRSEGRFVIYRARVDVLQDLIGFLTDNCCQGAPDRCAPAAVAVPPPRKRAAR
jgi:DNA-binding transcriptional ArsR family regulator